MKYAIGLIGLMALSACGADGEPERPTVSTGISVNSNGTVSTSTSMTVSQGNVSLTLGL